MNAQSIIPATAQTILMDFFLSQGTGQISLNFHEGRVKSWDYRKHEKATGPFCHKCGAPVHKGNGWRAEGGKFVCGNC